MKLSRRLYRQVEFKIRQALAADANRPEAAQQTETGTLAKPTGQEVSANR
jgi:hypothetical protein